MVLVGRRVPVTKIAIFLGLLSMAGGASSAELQFLGAIDQLGTGLGHVATVLTIQNPGVESGCVSWNGSVDITGPGGPACPAGIAGGDEKTGASQTVTRRLVDLGNPTADALRVIFNPNEPGSSRHLRVESLVLLVLAPSGALLLEAALAAPVELEATDSGAGSAGWAFALTNPEQVAGAFANGDNRIGLAATVSDADGGFETFFLAAVETGTGGTTLSADLDLAIDAAAECPRAQFNAQVHNAGPDSAEDVQVQFLPPAGTNLLSVTSSVGTCDVGVPVVCRLGTLAAGASASVSVVLRATDAGVAALSGEFQVTSQTPDPDPADSRRTATVAIDVDCDSVGGVSDNCPALFNPSQADADGDGVGDACEGDRDSDDVTDLVDNCPENTNSDQSDLDRDGVGDACDNCPTESNQAQLDADGNGAGNACELAVAGPPCPDGGDCRVAVRPAATLLVPWFAVDLARPNGLTTLLSITNIDSSPHLVSVTLWTDWAIPTLTFNLYLSGFDMQALNLRDIVQQGILPETGAGVSPVGELSSGAAAFPGCADAVAPARVAGERLLRYHTGRKVAGLCFASPRQDLMATGYVTVDVVNSCSPLNPSSPGYFVSGGQGVAANDNVLLGEYAYINAGGWAAEGEQAVHIAADPQAYGSGYTFYGRYVDGDASDNRQPLVARFAANYAQGGPQNRKTTLLVWRDTKTAAAAPVACGLDVAWAPLSAREQMAWDEEETVTSLPASKARFPLATQAVEVGSDALPITEPSGWIEIDLNHQDASLFGAVSQGWVTVIHAAGLGQSTGLHAAQLESVCAFE